MNVLLTGATGFLGSHLVPELVKEGCKVTCLLRPQNKKDAVSRLRESLENTCSDQAMVEGIFPHITVLEGDIVQDRLGLEEKVYCLLRDETDHILHCAASTSFSPDVEKEQWKSNVGGTENLVRLALEAGPSVGFHYVGTAYVAGDRDGVVYENELDVGQGFYNGYEKSKCFAEKMLHRYSLEKGLNLTVYRPSIIVGDSSTGRTVLFNGMYLFVRFLQVAKQSFNETDSRGRVKVPIRLLGNPEVTKNFVHIDYVVEMIKAIFTHPEAHGKTYHITHDNPPTLGFIREVILDLIGVTDTQLVGQESFNMEPATDLEDLLRQQINFYAPYLQKEPSFDTSNIKSAIPPGQCPECPPMDRKALETLFSYAVKSKWGRKKVSQETVPVQLPGQTARQGKGR